MVVETDLSPLLLVVPSSSVFITIGVPIGADVQILAVIVDFVEKSKGVSIIVYTPAYACPPFLMILARLLLVLPVV